jgi:predicted nucleic acid-binding protein
MKVIVDTSVWSLALRRSAIAANIETIELKKLIQNQSVIMLGCIRQELLSGIREPAQFERLRERLSAFPNQILNENCYELAAKMFNDCRAKGVQGSNTDFLICATAQLNQLVIYTTDQDFMRYQKILGISLYQPTSIQHGQS